jgi:hypothetical protein
MMMNKYCLLCERMVHPSRRFGVGTIILWCVSFGLWLLAMPLYPRRCPLCHGSAFGAPPPRKGHAFPVAQATPARPASPASADATAAALDRLGR